MHFHLFPYNKLSIAVCHCLGLPPPIGYFFALFGDAVLGWQIFGVLVPPCHSSLVLESFVMRQKALCLL